MATSGGVTQAAGQQVTGQQRAPLQARCAAIFLAHARDPVLLVSTSMS
jgi:hypothetical protein